MTVTRRTTLGLLTGSAVTVILAMNPAYAADTTVNVSLWDRGGNSMEMLGRGMPMGMGMMGNMKAVDMPMKMMGITADQAEVPAGEVTFKAVNDSTGTEHEMIVAPITDPHIALPYNSDEERVDEDAAGSLAEVPELEPGQSGSLTLRLKPGTYILYCNIAGHYTLGMWTLIKVV